MVGMKVTGDFKQLLNWCRKMRRFLEAGNQTLFSKLGQRMVRDFQQTVEHGGPGFKGNTEAGPERPSPATWPKTHPRWQALRRTGPRPLVRTGKFAKSFAYNTIPRGVDVGSTHIGSRRFHFGDEALGHGQGNAWRWAAPVYNGEIVDEMSQSFRSEVADQGAGHIQWFSPVIQQRGYLALYQDTLDDWWLHDVGGHLAGSN